MPPRFFAPDVSGLGVSVALPDDEAAHLTRVLRIEAGDTVTVFDGRGAEYLARVELAGKGGAVVRPQHAVTPQPEPSVALTVASALLKGRKFDGVVRDITMVGAVAVQPLLTDRTDVRDRDPGRWTKIAIASVKQCGRAVVPDIRPTASVTHFLTHDRSQVRLLLVEPGGAADAGTALRELEHQPPPQTATLAIGPEGGWSAEELRAASAAGFVPVTIGRRTLRADAVAVCAVSVLQFIWGDL